MTEDLWTSTDTYLADLLAPADTALEETLRSTVASGLPQIQVAPTQGKLLMVLALAIQARTILEIGTLAGYSTIWLARALPQDGRLTTLEADPKHAEVARANIERAGLADRVDVRLGRAQETLPRLTGDPFDLIFIDADKTGYPDYFTWALKLSHRGTLIIADNVVRNGAVADATSTDPNVQAVRRFIEMVAVEPRVSATVIQTVGSKGYDGLAIAVVTE